jgi:hypothetical protein
MGPLPASLLAPALQTLDSVQRFLRGAEHHRRSRIKVLPRLVCADGFSFSVQASSIHGCEPRTETGPYSSVECGALSRPVAELLPFMMPEEGIPPENGIYRCVPVKLVVQIINDHGGLIL